MNNNTIFNGMELVNMIRSGQDPQRMLISLLQSEAKNSPFMENLFVLANKGDTASIEKIARNVIAEQGGDYEKEFSNFKRFLGIK